MSRTESDRMALLFLRDNGPHTMGPICDEGALAAALTFAELKRAGLVSSVALGKGWVQYAITPAGEAKLEETAA